MTYLQLDRCEAQNRDGHHHFGHSTVMGMSRTPWVAGTFRPASSSSRRSHAASGRRGWPRRTSPRGAFADGMTDCLPEK